MEYPHMPHHRYSQNGQFKVYARFVRSCFSLDEDERLILLFIIDRSVERGKSTADITLKEFEGGIFRKRAGKRYMVVRGTGLPPQRITNAIDALVQIGAIQAYCNGPSFYCNINDGWLHPELPQQGPWAMWQLTESDYDYRSSEAE